MKLLSDFIKSKGYRTKLTDYYYVHFPFIDGLGSAYNMVREGYTVISFEDFKKLILKENNTETYEIY